MSDEKRTRCISRATRTGRPDWSSLGRSARATSKIRTQSTFGAITRSAESLRRRSRRLRFQSRLCKPWLLLRPQLLQKINMCKKRVRDWHAGTALLPMHAMILHPKWYTTRCAIRSPGTKRNAHLQKRFCPELRSPASLGRWNGRSAPSTALRN